MSPRRLRDPWTLLVALVVAIYGFIIGPIAITTAVSFNETNRSFFPPRGFSLKWWGEAFAPQWLQPLQFSLELAAVTAILATAVGVPLAFAFTRYEFPGKSLVRAITLGPLILPTLVTGIALLQFLTTIGMGRWMGYWALLIGHVVICLPFSVRTVAISLQAMPGTVEAAAASLGASPLRVLRHVTLPLIVPGVFAGMTFAFIHSFTDINLSLFVAKPGQRPVTVAILSFLEFGFAPTLAALSIVSLLIPLVLVAVLGRFIGIGNFLYQEQGRG
ncbi:MAG: ABC transporter permease [Alphaproteobacteria bacterium]|nr:ABC transporter permease [Alphaproteobacteria bacterium]